MTISVDGVMQGYCEGIAWLTEGDTGLEGSNGWSEDMQERISSDCAAFVAKLMETDLPDTLGGIDYSDARLGHDFWLTRNHHGAGFWDREELDFRPEPEARNVGEWLTEIAKTFPVLNVYKGDDNWEYFV